MFRKIVIVTPTMVLGAVAVKKVASDTQAASTPEVDSAHYQCKATELPLYTPLHSFNKIKRDAHPPKDSAVHSTIESGIRVVRMEVQSCYNVVSDQVKVLDVFYDTAKAHTAQTIDYLNEPHNVLPRSGAIAIGGLSGFIFAARGGFFKKLIYTTLGAGAIASMCYPRLAEEYAREALFEARKGFAIAYNFAKGVKPGDEVPVEPINKFPTSLEDVKFLMWDLYDEVKDTLFPKKK